MRKAVSIPPTPTRIGHRFPVTLLPTQADNAIIQPYAAFFSTNTKFHPRFHHVPFVVTFITCTTSCGKPVSLGDVQKGAATPSSSSSSNLPSSVHFEADTRTCVIGVNNTPIINQSLFRLPRPVKDTYRAYFQFGALSLCSATPDIGEQRDELQTADAVHIVNCLAVDFEDPEQPWWSTPLYFSIKVPQSSTAAVLQSTLDTLRPTILLLCQISRCNFMRLNGIPTDAFPALPHTLFVINNPTDISILMHGALMLHLVGQQCHSFRYDDAFMSFLPPAGLLTVITYVVRLFRRSIRLFSKCLALDGTGDAMIHSLICEPFFGGVQDVINHLIKYEPLLSLGLNSHNKLCSMRDLLAYMLQNHYDFFSEIDSWNNSQKSTGPLHFEKGDEITMECLCSDETKKVHMQHIFIPAKQ